MSGNKQLIGNNVCGLQTYAKNRHQAAQYLLVEANSYIYLQRLISGLRFFAGVPGNGPLARGLLKKRY